MSSIAASDIGPLSSQRAISRVTLGPATRLMNRLSVSRNPESGGEAVYTRIVSIEDQNHAVMRASPAASTGDMLENMAEVQERRKKDSQEPAPVPVALPPARLEVQLFVRKSSAPYQQEMPRTPQVDVMA